MTQETGSQTDSSQFTFGSGSFLNQNQGTTYFYNTYNDFSGRPVDEVVRIQHQQFLLQQQYQTQAPSSHQPPSGSTTSTQVPLGNQTPARKNPPRKGKKKDLPQHEILPTPQDTPEAPVESSSKKTDTQRDPDYQFVETQGVDD